MNIAFQIQHIFSSISSVNYWKLNKELCHSMVQDSLWMVCVWIWHLDLLQSSYDHEENNKRNFYGTLNTCIQACSLHDPDPILYSKESEQLLSQKKEPETSFFRTQARVRRKAANGEFVTGLSRLEKLTWSIAISSVKLQCNQWILNWQSKSLLKPSSHFSL